MEKNEKSTLDLNIPKVPACALGHVQCVAQGVPLLTPPVREPCLWKEARPPRGERRTRASAGGLSEESRWVGHG